MEIIGEIHVIKMYKTMKTLGKKSRHAELEGHDNKREQYKG
jgi:hypothetical protein